MSTQQVTALWRNQEGTSIEYSNLNSSSYGYTLAGTIILLLELQPHKIAYQICCDRHWQTKKATVCLETAVANRRLALTVDGNRCWRANSSPLEFAEGLFDVDLEVSPATNTLPIHRLSLEVGESKETKAVWVRFPSLTLEPLRQRYTRLSSRLYRYEAPSLGFEAQLEVYDDGLIVKYGELWMRIA